MTTTSAPTVVTPGNRLGEAVRQLATRASRPDAERALRIAGPVLLPTGAIVILLGWYGAANTTRVFLQIPYLISGGLLGLGLMFAGGFLYFARWLTDLLEESRRSTERAQETADRTALALERIERLLEQRPAVVTADAGPMPAPAAVDAGQLVVTDKGSMVHRPECRLVAGRHTRAVETTAGLGRCQICRPPAG